MFDLYFINSNYKWEHYCMKQDIQEIYRAIEILNLLGETDFYRIDIDNRVFTFLNNSEYQLEFMMNKYDTNEKCKPRYTSDEYDLGLENYKVKKKKR